VAIRDGREVITYADVIRAKQFKDLGPSENVEYIERERHATAVHEACHGVVAYRKRHHMAIDVATIEKGSNYLGMVASIPADELFTQWKSEYEADIMVALASLAGERYFFDGDNSSGVSGDLETATMVASYMEGHWGMGSTISSHAANRRNEIGGVAGGGGKGDDGKEIRRALSDRIESNLKRLMDEVATFIEENRAQVLSLAHALEIHKTLSGEDVEAVMEGKVGPLVDGRPYQNPENIELIEKYHIAAVAAHYQHQKPEIEIPRFA
jgi:ATP-dependent Zn protease